jgi:hypothetical protein
MQQEHQRLLFERIEVVVRTKQIRELPSRGTVWPPIPELKDLGKIINNKDAGIEGFC